MNEEKVFKTLKMCITNYIDDINETDIKLTDSLTGLGLDSIERGDILVDVMDELEVKIPLIEFRNASNIEGIVKIISLKIM